MEKELFDFINWTKIKVRLHLQKENIIPYFKEREIWWSSLGKNIGHEENGKNDMFERPILIIKKYNKHIFLCLPTTGQYKKGKYYYNLKNKDKQNTVLLSQLRILSSKRLLRKVGIISEKDFNSIKFQIKGFI